MNPGTSVHKQPQPPGAIDVIGLVDPWKLVIKPYREQGLVTRKHYLVPPQWLY